MTQPAAVTVTITNQRGLHARAAAKLAKLAGTYRAEVQVCRDTVCVPATSLLGLMMLGAPLGSELILRASGPEAPAALRALADLVARRFHEERE